MFIYFLSPFIHSDCLSQVQRLICETFGNFADRDSQWEESGGGVGRGKLFCWRAQEEGVLVHVHLCLRAEFRGCTNPDRKCRYSALTVHTSPSTPFERWCLSTCVPLLREVSQFCMWLRSCGCFGLCLPPISISAVSLKPSCIMHHLWLCGGRWRADGGIAPGLPLSEWINGGLL